MQRAQGMRFRQGERLNQRIDAFFFLLFASSVLQQLRHSATHQPNRKLDEGDIREDVDMRRAAKNEKSRANRDSKRVKYCMRKASAAFMPCQC